MASQIRCSFASIIIGVSMVFQPAGALVVQYIKVTLSKGELEQSFHLFSKENNVTSL